MRASHDVPMLVERLVHAQDLAFHRCTHLALDLGRQREPRHAAAPAVRLAAAGKVDYDGTHDAARPAHEVDPVVQLQSSGAGKAEIGLVYQ